MLDGTVMRILKITAAAIMSLGWVVPMYVAISWIAQWNRLVVQAGSAQAAAAQNSFPFIDASEQFATVAVVWAIVAIVVWIGWGVWTTISKRGEQ
jgi:hypothetical protein